MRRPTRSAGPAWAAVVVLALGMLRTVASADALVWPDVAERVEHDMSAADPATRRAAARDLATLGSRRGGALALAALDDPDDEVRLAAADAAVRLRTAAATDRVATWLNASDVRLRRKACEVARSLPSARAVAPLARTLGDPDPDVRSAAAEALGHQGVGEAVPPLLGRLDDPAPAVRIQVVAALARLGDPRAVVPLVGKIQDSSADVRQAVTRALGDLGDVRASTALVLALRDPGEDVRRDALRALGRMHPSDAIDAMTPFVSDRSAALRGAALEALGRIASPEAVRVLIGALGVGDDAAASLEHTPVRDALVDAGPSAIAPLHGILVASPSVREATSAAWILGHLHARSEAPTIVAALRQGSLPPAAALRALAGAGTTADVPVVLEFLTDPSPSVRGEALGAAAALLDPDHPDGRAVEPLGGALRDARPSTQERARIASLLGRTGAPRAATLLADLVRAADIPLRVAAIDALGVLGPAGADDALLEPIESPDPAVRLHAAVALSESGGARARDWLVARLTGDAETDRAAVLTALGGVLARAPSDHAIAQLAAALEMAAGPERDGLIEAIGRAPSAAAMRVLAALARASDPDDRRQTAALLAAHSGDDAAVAAARSLIADADASVRAQAAWSLGTIGDTADIARLESVARGPDNDAATNAAAAIGRVSARRHAPELASRALCPLLADGRPYVKANALAGLALTSARCGDGGVERALVTADGSDYVRAAAALVLARATTPDDRRALDRCSRLDPSGAVAARCQTPARAPARTHPALVYVVAYGAAEGTSPRPGAAYAIALSDGMIHAGTTDQRGAVFDPVVPEGELELRPASALAR